MTQYYLERMANERLDGLRAEAARAALLREAGPRGSWLRHVLGAALVRAGRRLLGELPGTWVSEPGRLR